MPRFLQELPHRYVAISRRGAIHLATMGRRGVTRILSFGAAFDGHPGVERLGG